MSTHWRTRSVSDVESLIFEVEVARDTKPDVVADPAAATKLRERLTLGFEQLPAQALVVLRAGLDASVVFLVEAGTEPIASEAIRPP
jgi:hypothetical protein